MVVVVSVHGKGFDRFSEKALNRGLYYFTNQMALVFVFFVFFFFAYDILYWYIIGLPIAYLTTSEHPQATSRWDLKAKSLYSNNWVRVFKKGLLDGKVVEYHGPKG